MGEDQPILAQKPSTWSKRKIGLLILAALLFVGTILFHLVADKVKHAAEQLLLTKATATVNGQLLVGRLNLSVLGYVEAKEIQLLDGSGSLLAKIDRLHIRYNWSDLLSGQLGPQLIQELTVEKPEIWITYHQNGLNWENVLKPTATEQPDFSPLVTFTDGKVHLTTDFFEKNLEQLTGQMDFRQEKQLVLSFTGKVDQTPLRINGHWATHGPAEITLSGEKIDLVKLGLTTPDDPLQLTGGSLDEFLLAIGRQEASDPMSLTTFAGRFSGVAVTGVLELEQGSAHFQKEGDAIHFTTGQALYQGQTVAFDGQVLTSPSGDKTLDFDVRMPSGDPAVLLSPLQAGGALAVQGKVSGSALSPVLYGDFSLGSLQLSNMQITGIHGSFSYSGQTLQLLTANGATLGGSSAASGQVYPKSQQYALSVSGSNLNTSQLTEKDVKGPLSFTGTANGTADAGIVQGSFTITNGSAYGIAFRSLTGNFIKQGSSEAEVSNLAIETDFGVFYPEQLNQSVMQQLRERNLPTTRAELEEKVKERIREKILGAFLR